MRIGPITKLPPPPLIAFVDEYIERVTSLKLLGVSVTNTLNWDEHVDDICSKASKTFTLCFCCGE